METLWKGLFRRICVVAGFAVMVVVNWMAVVGKINGITTAAVSDKHPSLFTPKGYTFSIWSVIYLFLAVYVLYQLLTKDRSKDGTQGKIAFWFVLSCAANAGWIFLWHYDQIVLSVIVMGLLLYFLINILSLISGFGHSPGSTLGLEIPFGLYTGWITVATFANIAVLLVNLGWRTLDIAEYIPVIVLLLIATFSAFAIEGETKNVIYPAAVIWGLCGVLVRYLPLFQWDVKNQAMWLVIAIVFGILVLLIRWITVIVRRAQ